MELLLWSALDDEQENNLQQCFAISINSDSLGEGETQDVLNVSGFD